MHRKSESRQTNQATFILQYHNPKGELWGTAGAGQMSVLAFNIQYQCIEVILSTVNHAIHKLISQMTCLRVGFLVEPLHYRNELQQCWMH